jgi:hypothetical protein
VISIKQFWMSGKWVKKPAQFALVFPIRYIEGQIIVTRNGEKVAEREGHTPYHIPEPVMLEEEV